MIWFSEALAVMAKLMTPFIENLRKGGPAFTVEDIDSGFLIHLVQGHESGFNQIARLVMDKAGLDYSAFPRSDGRGSYDCVHVILHER